MPIEELFQVDNTSTSNAKNENAFELDNIHNWIRQAADVCEQAAKGNLEARLLNVDVEGDLARMIYGINSLLDNTDAFIREAKASLDHAAKGKFFSSFVITRHERHVQTGFATNQFSNRRDGIAITSSCGLKERTTRTRR